MTLRIIQSIVVIAFLSASHLAARSGGASQKKAKSSTSSYSFENDPRPEIRAVAGAIETALNGYRAAGPDAGAKQRALSLLLVTAQADRLSVAFGPTAALQQAMSQLTSQFENNQSALNSAASAVNSVRPDVQAAAPAQTAGSTQLVEKAGGSSLLAFAVDTGSFSQTQTGTTTTLSGNLYGIYSSFTSPADAVCGPQNHSGSCSWRGALPRNTNVSASFNLAQASTETTTQTQPVTGTSSITAGTTVSVPSSVGKLSAISAKFSLHNKFNPNSTSFRNNWTQAIASDADTMSSAVSKSITTTQQFITAIQNLEGNAANASILLRLLDQDAQALIAGANTDGGTMEKKFADDLDNYYQNAYSNAVKANPNFYQIVSAQIAASNALKQLNQDVINNALGNMFSLEYDYVRTPQQPDEHNATFIWGNAPTSSANNTTKGSATPTTPSMFSANLGVSVYGGTIPSGLKYGRLHYGQASAEFDFPFNLNSSTKNAVFTIAGYWQYQPNPSLLTITQTNVAPGTTISAPTQVLVGTAGNLYVAQAKISLKSNKAGINVPLGFKWSNKTDLLSGGKYAGQIGISCDFSSLSSFFGSSESQ